ncbi:MAG TPA: hypothetical protein VFQ05_14240, partial [Candidatus Eisenbacteria bacterium]|nr:hypothetical protein [Candidatus Eisenbacteria bacterium]
MSAKLMVYLGLLVAALSTTSADAQPPPCVDVGTIKVEPRNWFQDTFTSNETIVAPTFGAYDTTSAWIRTGLNLAQLTGDMNRQDLPGDTVVAEAPGSGLRLDLVFRILPGVGNYVTIGNRNSPLRLVPTSTTRVPVVP